VAKAYTAPATVESPSNIWKVIIASSLGTMIEWYDFYIFGSLAAIIATKFFPETNPTAAFLSTLATFGAGFAARPFGALFFGRIGDLVGRKYAFLVTLLIMGGATTLIGLLPTYQQIGLLAPIILFTIRILQGLAWAANTAARRSMSPNIPPATGAATTPVSSRPPPLSACSSRWR
jgi:MFS family permease